MVSFKAIHFTGAGLSVAGVLGVIGTALGWFSKNVSVQGAAVCVDNPGLVGVVTALLTVAGAVTLLMAPSTSSKVNVAAAKQVPGVTVSQS
jgi:hypothetical protein